MTAARSIAKQDAPEIAVELLYVSPEEARKTIDSAALNELADSIARSGVIEPLLARVTGGAAGPFEIVAGQRRWLASKIAGKTTCPCIVREMSDDEARELRIISNLQREDLPAMEEAEAYGKLLDAPGATIESVAAALAKSPSYVGRRVQLLKAIEPVREALKHGAIEVGHALELARLDQALQRQMLTRMQCGATLVEPDDVVDEEGEEGVCRFCGCTEDDPSCPAGCGWANEEQTICDSPECLERFREETQQQTSPWQKTHYSVVELRREIEETAHHDLKDAPFPLIAELHPMPCSECPKRAGNTQLLFDDCAQDTCTDRPCFNRKVNAWIDVQLAAAASEKRKLLKLTHNWSSEKDKVYVSDYGGSRVLKSAAECEYAEQGIWVDGRSAGHLATICRKADCKTHHSQSGSSGRSSQTRTKPSEAEQAERRKILDKVKAEMSYRAALVEAITRAPIPAGAANELNLQVCAALIGQIDGMHSSELAAALGWEEKVFGYGGDKKLQEKLKAAGQLERLRLALLSTAANELRVNEYSLNSKPEDLEKLARLLDLDPKKIRAQAPKPSAATAAPAKKAAAKPAKKKAVLSPTAKKRIAEAQRKRWAQAQKPAAKKAAKKAGKR